MSSPISALGIQERHLTAQDTKSTKKLIESCGLASSWNLVLCEICASTCLLPREKCTIWSDLQTLAAATYATEIVTLAAGSEHPTSCKGKASGFNIPAGWVPMVQ